MSRARDLANLGDQAGSGLDASDITTGTLGNTVQDNITRLGTVTTGTLSHGTTLQGYVDSSNTGVTFPAGHIIQVQFRGFNGVQTIGNGSLTGKTFVNIGTGVSGEEFSIDMAVSSGNKIIGFGAVNLSANARYSAIKVFMDSTQIAKGTADGNRTEVTVSSQRNSSATNDSILMHNSAFQFHYTPSDTSSHTYKVQAGNTWDNSYYTYINRQPDDADQNLYNHRGYSHFMLMEVAQ